LFQTQQKDTTVIIMTTTRRQQCMYYGHIVAVSVLPFSDAPIWNLADIPITDNVQ